MASIPHITVLGSLNMDLVAYVPHRMRYVFSHSPISVFPPTAFHP